MGSGALRTGLGLLYLTIAVSGFGQEGHPLTGTWSGSWGPEGAERDHLTLVMMWDGEQIGGIINPGPDSIQIGSVYLDVVDWNVRLEADTRNGPGETVHIVAEGKLEALESSHRTITGTWRQGAIEGDFQLTRD